MYGLCDLSQQAFRSFAALAFDRVPSGMDGKGPTTALTIGIKPSRVGYPTLGAVVPAPFSPVTFLWGG